MKIDIPKGTYVVAVSGGVDSVVLMDLLTHKKGLKLIIAHFDHGIRDDSSEDKQLVQQIAKKYKLPFVYDEAKLGPGASEEKAREARYKFLKMVQKASGADAVITAHHEDDAIETVVINIIRGTHRKGASSLKSGQDMVRPMLHLKKDDIIKYAKEHELKWREDSTNKDSNYLRNRVRHEILPKFSPEQRKQFREHVMELHKLNKEIDDNIREQIEEEIEDNALDRHWFVMLPHDVSMEIMAAWLRENSIELDTRKLEIAVRGAKVLESDRQVELDKTHSLKVGKDKLALERIER